MDRADAAFERRDGDDLRAPNALKLHSVRLPSSMKHSQLFNPSPDIRFLLRWMKILISRTYLRFRSERQKEIDQEQILALLKGTRGTEPCWTNIPLRDHILKRVEETFGPDWYCQTQALIGLYLEKELTFKLADQIIQDVADINLLYTPREMCGVGKGWNPIRIMHLLEAATGEDYSYVPLFHPNWTSRYRPKRTDANKLVAWVPIAEYKGTRGCVNTVTFHTAEPGTKGDKCVAQFEELYARIMPKFLAGADDSSVKAAIKARSHFKGEIAGVAIEFIIGDPQRDWRDPPSTQATLKLAHPVRAA